MTDVNTFNSNYVVLSASANNDYAAGIEMRAWWRMTDDGVNRITYISGDGFAWTQVHSVGRADFLTANQIGWGVRGGNATYTQSARLIHWSVT
jgi:hypothetical protein